MEGIVTPTIAIFADEGAPALLGAYTLEGALLVVDPVASGWRQPTRCGSTVEPDP